jgi:pyruvate dehydrogenase E1 component alpha subunit
MSGSNAMPDPGPDELRKLYYDMLLIRRFEEKTGQLYGMGFIGGFCHPYIGQEAVVVGVQSQQDPIDTVITAYRDHGHMLATGMDPKGVMAELTGRYKGYSKGKGGSMHMFSKEVNFFGGHGIVGASTSLGTGLGFSHHYLQDGGLCVTYMGDGAANQGQTAESYNMAALWKLPVLYIIENNQYGMGTSTARHAAGELYRRGEGYDIPCEQVDGMDIFAIQRSARQALDHIRDGNGPYILEMMTYRYRGHSVSDPAKYRSREELDKYRKDHDPLLIAKDAMYKAGIEDDELTQMDKDIKNLVNEAAEFAQETPEPPPEELYKDVLVPVDEG